MDSCYLGSNTVTAGIEGNSKDVEDSFFLLSLFIIRKWPLSLLIQPAVVMSHVMVQSQQVLFFSIIQQRFGFGCPVTLPGG